MEILHESTENKGDGWTAPHTIRLSRTPTGFVTHWHNTQDGGNYFGNYFDADEKDSAILNFIQRCKNADCEPLPL